MDMDQEGKASSHAKIDSIMSRNESVIEKENVCP